LLAETNTASLIRELRVSTVNSVIGGE